MGSREQLAISILKKTVREGKGRRVAHYIQERVKRVQDRMEA